MDWKTLIKNFRHKKLQTVLILLIISLCSMLLTASFNILISLDKPFEDLAKECEAPSAILYPSSIDNASVLSMGKKFSELPQIEEVEYEKYHYISEEITYKGEKLEGFFKLTEFNHRINSKERYLEGNQDVISLLKDNECILPACISNEYNIHTGDAIKIKLPEETLEYTVRAVYSDPYNSSTAFDSNILVKSLPKAVAQELQIILYAREGISGDKIEEAYRLKHDGQMDGQIATLEERIDKGLIVGNVAGGLFLAIGVIMLLVSCLIISFMIRNAIITDAKTIAVYKTIGYTSGDVLKMYLGFYFSVVTVACVMGIGSSLIISNTILTSIYENIGEVSANNMVLPAVLCYIIVVAIVTSLIYSIIGKANKIKPVYALNGFIETSTKKKHKYKGNSKLQFSALGISMRNLTRNKRGAVSTVLTAVLTIFSVNFTVISLDVAYTMKDNNDFWLGVDKSDVMIEVTDKTQYDKVIKSIKEDSRVDHYLESVLGDKVGMKWKKGMSTTVMKAFVYDDFNAAKLPVVRGENPKNENEIAISSKIAGELNKDVGDFLEIYINNTTRVDALITGIFQTYFELGDCCRLTSETYKNKNVNLNYSNISIYLKSNEDNSTFINDIKEKIGGSGNVTLRTEAFASIMNMIVRPQENAIPPVTVLVLLIGAINIYCIVMIKNATSQKNNGIYKCIGYTTGHLILSNMYYVGIIAALSMTVAIPAVIITYPLIMKSSLAMFGFLEYPVSYDLWHIVLTNIGVVVIFVLSTLISSRSLKNVNVRDLVQE